MSFLVPTPFSDRTTVTSTSQVFSQSMVAGEYYVLTSDIACYILQGAAPTASAADLNTYVAAGQSVPIDGGIGTKLAIIRVGSSDGVATLTRAKLVP